MCWPTSTPPGTSRTAGTGPTADGSRSVGEAVGGGSSARARPLADAALQLGHAGRAGDHLDGVPEPQRLLAPRDPRDHRTEEACRRGTTERDDRRPDIPTDPGQ